MTNPPALNVIFDYWEITDVVVHALQRKGGDLKEYFCGGV